MAFWLIAAAMLIAAVAVVLPPLLQRAGGDADASHKREHTEEQTATVRVYRERLAELRRDHERGHLSAADLEAAEAEAVIRTIHHLTPRLEAAVGADAANIGFNDGEVAGQVIPHVHGHIIPRFPDDGGRNIHAVAARQLDLSEDELDVVADDIRHAL